MTIILSLLRLLAIRSLPPAAAVMLAMAGFASGPAMAEKGPCDDSLKTCGIAAAGVAGAGTIKSCRSLRKCKKECRVTKRDCKKDCRGDKKACKDICRDKHGTGKDYRACRKLCREDKHFCAKNCRSEKKDCKDVCRYSYLTPDCKAARTVLRTSAIGAIASCATALACLAREQDKEEATQ